MRYVVVIILIILFCNKIQGQTSLKGVVSDSLTQKPLERSSVVAYAWKTKKLIKFAFTDKEGRFSLDIPVGDADSLQVTVKYLGYATASKTISKTETVVNFHLMPQEFILNEVAIKPLAVRQEGDTLTFNPTKFEKANDTSLEDVLKRLPGVEVGKDGKISYNGQQINKFYIEGLNLLDGKYNLATKNISKEDIAEINVFKNHQPIKALQDSEFSESPAMNIKLSKKNILIGNGRAGVSPNLKIGDVNFSPLFFSEKLQLLSTSQFNNSGRDLLRQFRSFDVNAYAFLEKIPDNRRGILSYTNRPAPSFDNDLLRFNQTFAQSFNLLKKLPKDFQIKTNINAYSNRENNAYDYVTQFYLTGFENLDRRGNQALRRHLGNIDGTVDIEKNTKKLYFKNQLLVNTHNERNNGTNEETDLPLTSIALNSQYTHLSNTVFTVIPTAKKRSLSIYSLVSYSQNSQVAQISPLPLFFDTLQTSVNDLRQGYANTNFSTVNSLSYTLGKQKVKWLNRLVWVYDRNRLESEMEVQQQDLLGDEFKNAVNWEKNNLEYSSEISYNAPKYVLRGVLAANNYHFNVTERFNDLRFTRNVMVLNPSLYFFSRFQSKFNVEANIIKRNDFGTVQSIFPGYILVRSSQLSRNVGRLGAYEQWSFNSRVKYADVINSFYANVGFVFSLNANELVNSTQFSVEGNLENITLEQKNRSDRRQWFSSFEKNFHKIKLDVRLRTFFTSDRQNVLINRELSSIIQDNFTTNFNLTKAFSKRFYVDYAFAFNRSISEFGGTVAPYSFVTTSQTAGFNYSVPNKWNVRLNNRYAAFNFADQNFDNFFTDLRLSIPTKNKKLSFEVEWQNVLNAKNYVILDRSTSFQTVSVLPVRSSQFLGYINFKF